jgi:hypothetical protein
MSRHPHTLVALLALLAACPPRDIPEHLMVDKPEAASEAAAFTDVAGAVAYAVGRDPLARTPRTPDAARLATLGADAEPLVAWSGAVAQVESGQSDAAVVLQQVEDQWRGTPAVPLARGYRLGVAQRQIRAAEGLTPDLEGQVLTLLTPLRAPPESAELKAGAWDWLGGGSQEAVLAYGDRYVLTGWLDGPRIPVAAAAKALEAENYDPLRATALGNLLTARATGASASPDEGLADLQRATALALERAAADRDKEQAAWSDRRKAVAAELSLPADADPVAALLQRAAERLTAAGADDRAAGGALLAIHAARLSPKCAEPPCRGPDRVDGITAAGRWHPDVAALARVWRVVALKGAVDAMDVGHDTVMYPEAAIDLVDALIGSGVGPLDASLLRRERGDPALWLAIGRASGADAALDWPGARAAVGKHLAQEAEKAASGAEPASAAFLKRIGERATR